MTLGLRNAIITIFVFFLFLFLFVRFAGPISINSVTTTKTDFFTADGVGEVSATANAANFSVGVTETASTEQEAKNQMNTITNKVIADLKALGISDKDIQTTNLSVYPNPPAQVVPDTSVQSFQVAPVKPGQTGGFTATQNLQVKATSIDLANKAFDTATADGANQISGVSFALDDAMQKQLEDKARKLAIADAKKNAQTLANEAGITLGRIVNISTNGGAQPVALRAMALQKEDTSNTNLQPGENKISVSVTLSYETR